MADGVRKSDLVTEEPREGEKCQCGEEDDLIVCYTPVHNGVYTQGHRVVLCQACGYMLAEHIQEFWS